MTTRRLGNGTVVYRDRIREPIGRTHRADSGDPPGLCYPRYRGFKLACTGAEIPRLQRAIDAWWDRRYAEAATPADKAAVLMDERAQRTEPEDWNSE